MAAKQEATSTKTNKLGNIGTSYFLFYNFLQFVGWSYILILSINHLMQKKSYVGLWGRVHQPLKIFQTLAVLEVVHSLFGLTRSSPIINLMQVSSRLFLVWGIMHSVPDIVDCIGFLLLNIAWCLAEIPRYLYYALELIHMSPSLLIWCRYSFFMFLYPLGITGEILAMLAAIPYIREKKIHSMFLPNAWNFSFDFSFPIVILIISYIPLSPQLYTYMLKQRKKVLGTDKQKLK